MTTVTNSTASQYSHLKIDNDAEHHVEKVRKEGSFLGEKIGALINIINVTKSEKPEKINIEHEREVGEQAVTNDRHSPFFKKFKHISNQLIESVKFESFNYHHGHDENVNKKNTCKTLAKDSMTVPASHYGIDDCDKRKDVEKLLEMLNSYASSCRGRKDRFEKLEKNIESSDLLKEYFCFRDNNIKYKLESSRMSVRDLCLIYQNFSKVHAKKGDFTLQLETCLIKDYNVSTSLLESFKVIEDKDTAKKVAELYKKSISGHDSFAKFSRRFEKLVYLEIEKMGVLDAFLGLKKDIDKNKVSSKDKSNCIKQVYATINGLNYELVEQHLIEVSHEYVNSMLEAISANVSAHLENPVRKKILL